MSCICTIFTLLHQKEWLFLVINLKKKAKIPISVAKTIIYRKHALISHAQLWVKGLI